MPSETGSDRHTDHKRHPPPAGQLIQIPESGQNIIFLITASIFCNSKKVFQIFFCRLQLYHRNHRLRSSPQKLSTAFRTSGSHTCNKCSMPVCILRGYQFLRIFQMQSRIDSFFGILCSILKAIRRIPVLNCLIPDPRNSCCPVKITEYRIGIINPRIQETNHNPLAHKLQRRIILQCNNSGCIQRLHIQKCITLGDRTVPVLPQG